MHPVGPTYPTSAVQLAWPTLAICSACPPSLLRPLLSQSQEGDEEKVCRRRRPAPLVVLPPVPVPHRTVHIPTMWRSPGTSARASPGTSREPFVSGARSGSWWTTRGLLSSCLWQYMPRKQERKACATCSCRNAGRGFSRPYGEHTWGSTILIINHSCVGRIPSMRATCSTIHEMPTADCSSILG